MSHRVIVLLAALMVGAFTVSGATAAEPGRDGRGQLDDRIKRPVALNSKQTQRYSDIRFTGHDGGDFVFVRRNQK